MVDINTHYVTELSCNVRRSTQEVFYLTLLSEIEVSHGYEEEYETHIDTFTFFFDKKADIERIAEALSKASERLMELKDTLETPDSTDKEEIPF